MNNENYYSSSDLSLVAALSLFTPIVKIDKKNRERIIFSFDDTAQLQRLVDLYWRKELRVEPSAYFNEIRTLKTLIFADKPIPVSKSIHEK